jgi:hypothetical protein
VYVVAVPSAVKLTLIDEELTTEGVGAESAFKVVSDVLVPAVDCEPENDDG